MRMVKITPPRFPLARKKNLQKYLISLPQWGDPHLPTFSTIWKALIYKVVIFGSLVSPMGHLPNGHLPKCMSCHKTILIISSMAHCFHEYTQNVLKQKVKLEAHFVKNTYISLLYIDYHIIVIYIIDLFYIYIILYILYILYIIQYFETVLICPFVFTI